MAKIYESQRQTGVLHEAEVIVVGGGPAGIAAALASARMGAQTILLDRFGSLGGLQAYGNSPTFSFVDPELHGGIIQEIMGRLKEDGALKNIDDVPGPRSHIKAGVIAAVGAGNLPKRFVETDVGTWGSWSQPFDAQYYKFLLDQMMQEANVRLLYHVWAAGAIREGNLLKGVIIEGKEGRRAILGKIIIDTTGDGFIAWQCGAPVTGSEGYPAGRKKGRQSGWLSTFVIAGVDVVKLRKYKQDNIAEWTGMFGGLELVKQAKAKGAYIKRESIILSEHYDIYNTGRISVMHPVHVVAEGNTCWSIKELTDCEIDLRKQSWALYKMLKENVPGFEHSCIENTPQISSAGNGHRIIGEHTVTIGDMREGRSFDDGVSINNMHPDLFEIAGRFAYETLPHDIPYRSLVSKEIDNLLAAGGTISCGGFAQGAIKYGTPTICMGQAAGTAAGLAATKNVTPKMLDVKLLQDALRKQGAHPTVRDVSDEVLAPYRALKKMSIVVRLPGVDPLTSEEEAELSLY